MEKHFSDLPLVTISIPTYNAEDTIEETLKSVLNQTYKNLLVTIVDNASVDRTLEIVNSFNDTRVKVDIIDKTIDFCSNWNRALTFCGGDFFKFLPDDDLLEATSIEEMVYLMQNRKDIAMVGSFRTIINAKSETLYKRGKLIGDKHLCDFDEFLYKTVTMATNPVGEPGSVLFRSKVIIENDVKFSDTYELFIDVDFYIRVLEHGKCYMIDEYLYKFRVWSDSYSVRNEKKQFQDTKYFFQMLTKKYDTVSRYTLFLNRINQYKNRFLKKIFYTLVVK